MGRRPLRWSALGGAGAFSSAERELIGCDTFELSHRTFERVGPRLGCVQHCGKIVSVTKWVLRCLTFLIGFNVCPGYQGMSHGDIDGLKKSL